MRLLVRNMPRYLLFWLAIAAFAAACKNDSGKATALQSALADSARFTTIQWLDSVRNFGTIPEGQKLEVAFRFRNTGTMPLVIVKVQPSCGCTVADQPTEPIAPGGEGQIKAIFNSKGHAGVNHKTLFVTANTRGTRSHSLTFLVIVERTAS
jgi:hypothetical protein